MNKYLSILHWVWKGLDLLVVFINVPMLCFACVLLPLLPIGVIFNLFVPVKRVPLIISEAFMLISLWLDIGVVGGVVALFFAAIIDKKELSAQKWFKYPVVAGLLLGITAACFMAPFSFKSYGGDDFLSTLTKEKSLPLAVVAGGMKVYGFVLVYMIVSASMHLIGIFKKFFRPK